MSELLKTLGSIHSKAHAVATQIREEQWEQPTPCTEWNVRQLVRHMAGTNVVLAAAAQRSAPEVSDPNDFDAGDDVLGALRDATDRSYAAWSADGALEGMVSIPGDMPAEMSLGILVLDTGTHVWDLARAIGVDHGLSSEEIATIDRLNRQLVSDEARSSGAFGPVLTPGSDDDLTGMLAYVGRVG